MAKKEVQKIKSTCSLCGDFKTIVAVLYNKAICEQCFIKTQRNRRKA